MSLDPQQLIAGAWIVWCLGWCVASLFTKRPARRMPRGALLVHILVLVLACKLIYGDFFRVGFLKIRFVPAAEWTGWLGCAVTLAGLAFTVWARFRLGRNWSGTVQVKEDHQLVRSGPYELVRHPIYSGLSLAMLGAAIVFGEVRCLVGTALAFFEYKRKSLLEERFMIEQFGADYLAYRRQVKAIIPFVW